MRTFLGLAAFWLSLLVSVLEAHINEIPQPEFAEPIPNITATSGREVRIPCIVNNIQKYKVAWIHTNRYTLLTMGTRVVTKSNRYKVSNNGKGSWWLYISSVKESDRGEYMCQVNTIPMMTQVGYIEVVVPPFFDERVTSSDTEVREGSNVNLRCESKGSPEPKVIWRREDGQDIVIGEHKKATVKGKFLNITNISRLHMGAYHCISTNGVPPALSKRIVLAVSFTPMVWIPNHMIGAPATTDVLLQCNLESHPRSITYWMREGGVMVISNSKYLIEVVPFVHYKAQLNLQIRNLQPEDFGSYICVAKNSLGESEGTIRLYEIPPKTINNRNNLEIFNSKSEKRKNHKGINSLLNYGGIPAVDDIDDNSGIDGDTFSRSFYTKRGSSVQTGRADSTSPLSNILCLISTILGSVATYLAI